MTKICLNYHVYLKNIYIYIFHKNILFSCLLLKEISQTLIICHAK